MVRGLRLQNVLMRVLFFDFQYSSNMISLFGKSEDFVRFSDHVT